MDVKKKLDKRALELEELTNICQDFDQQLFDMHDNVSQELHILDEKSRSNVHTDIRLCDEEGNPINLMDELLKVKNELN